MPFQEFGNYSIEVKLFVSEIMEALRVRASVAKFNAFGKI